MNAKRLHIHSLPFVAVALVITGVTLLAVASARGSAVALAFLHPIVQVEPTSDGLATIRPNKPEPEIVEIPGLKIEVSAPPTGLSSVSSIGSSVTLQQIVGQVFTTGVRVK